MSPTQFARQWCFFSDEGIEETTTDSQTLRSVFGIGLFRGPEALLAQSTHLLSLVRGPDKLLGLRAGKNIVRPTVGRI